MDRRGGPGRFLGWLLGHLGLGSGLGRLLGGRSCCFSCQGPLLGSHLGCFQFFSLCFCHYKQSCFLARVFLHTEAMVVFRRDPQELDH